MSPYRFCLWGHRQGYVQVGSELDRAIWPAWRNGLQTHSALAELRRLHRLRVAGDLRRARERRWREMTEAMRRMGVSLEQATRTAVAFGEAFRRATESLKAQSGPSKGSAAKLTDAVLGTENG